MSPQEDTFLRSIRIVSASGLLLLILCSCEPSPALADLIATCRLCIFHSPEERPPQSLSDLFRQSPQLWSGTQTTPTPSIQLLQRRRQAYTHRYLSKTKHIWRECAGRYWWNRRIGLGYYYVSVSLGLQIIYRPGFRILPLCSGHT